MNKHTNTNIINRWVAAKAAVRVQTARIQKIIDSFMADFQTVTGQRAKCCYEPFLTRNRRADCGEWYPADRGALQLHGTFLRIVGEDGNGFDPTSESHWPISISMTEKLAIEMAGMTNSFVIEQLDTAQTFQ